MLDENNHLVDDTSWTDKHGNEQTEPQALVEKPKVTKAELADRYEKQNNTQTLGQGAGYDENWTGLPEDAPKEDEGSGDTENEETEPEPLVNPGEGDD